MNGGIYMEYLQKVLGLKLTYINDDIKHIPNFVGTRYVLRNVLLDRQKAVFIYPKTELEQIETLKKHISKIKSIVNLPVVMILDEITYRQKEYLLREKIPFVVNNKQIYLPFMALYLQERCNAETFPNEEILPSAQVLLLYFIYNGTVEITTSQASKELGLTPTSISRASRQLEKLGLIQTMKIGKQKIIHSDSSPKELFERTQQKLLNPVKKTVYIPKNCVTSELLESGYFALAHYTMINVPQIKYFATDSISRWKDVMTNNLLDSENQMAVEMWRYNPHLLSKEDKVDELSLALSLRDDADERVEAAVDEMLEKLWGKI